MVWTSPPNRPYDFLIGLVACVLALYLWPFWIVLGIYLLTRLTYRAFVRRRLLREIRARWTPQGTKVLFFTSNNKQWVSHFEQVLLPKIVKKAQVINWSNRNQTGWNERQLEARIAQYFGNWYRNGKGIAPCAFVLLPTGKLKPFFFKEAFSRCLKSGRSEFAEMEREFLALV